MRKGKLQKAGSVLGLVLVSAVLLSAQQAFNTTVYFDYSYFLTDAGPLAKSSLNNYFTFRRAYFTYENKINDSHLDTWQEYTDIFRDQWKKWQEDYSQEYRVKMKKLNEEISKKYKDFAEETKKATKQSRLFLKKNWFRI